MIIDPSPRKNIDYFLCFSVNRNFKSTVFNAIRIKCNTFNKQTLTGFSKCFTEYGLDLKTNGVE